MPSLHVNGRRLTTPIEALNNQKQLFAGEDDHVPSLESDVYPDTDELHFLRLLLQSNKA